MEIQTERCIVRQFNEYDIEAFMAYRNDLEWMKYQGFKGLTKQEYEKALLGSHSLQKGMQLAIVCKDFDILIGDVYLKQENSTFWIGYTVCPSKARQGYAYEVLSAIIDTLREEGIKYIKASVESENTPSIALLKKLKFSYIGTDNDEQIFVLSL
jgi:RimJ/RimL family protein N-acetyltransferase